MKIGAKVKLFIVAVATGFILVGCYAGGTGSQIEPNPSTQVPSQKPKPTPTPKPTKQQKPPQDQGQGQK